MKKILVSLVGAALLSVGVAAPSFAGTGSVTGYGSEGTTLTVKAVARDVTLKRGDVKQIYVDIYASASDQFTLDTGNWLTLTSANGFGAEMEDLKPVAGEPNHQRALVTFAADTPTGKWYVNVRVSGEVAYWDDYFQDWESDYVYTSQDAVASFSIFGAPKPAAPPAPPKPVVRTTYLTANASPEPVKRGKTVTVKGSLKYRTSTGTHAVLNKRTVKVYFDPKGSKPAKYVGSARTNTKGAYIKEFKASTSGTWIVKYAGSSTLKADRATDYVRVKR